MKISISDLELYMKCPRAYKLHCIENVEPERKNLSLSKAVVTRKVISKLHSESKSIQEVTQEEIENFCEEVWKQEISDQKVDREEVNTIAIQAKPATKTKPETIAVTKGQKALESIKTWCVNYAKSEQNAKVLYSNVYFEDRICETEFYGYIDQIREYQGETQLLCFKTSCHLPGVTYLARDFQISLCCHAIWQGKLYPNFPDVSESVELRVIPASYWYYFPYLETYKKSNGNGKKGDLKGEPLIPGHRTQHVLLDFEYELLQSASGIEFQYFPMNITSPCGCEICTFAHACKNAVAEVCNIPEYIEVLQE